MGGLWFVFPLSGRQRAHVLTPKSLGVFRNGSYGTHVMVDKPEHLA